MALKTSKAIQPSNSTNQLFRDWSKFIFDGLIAGGWVQTSDTGQINFGTVTVPGTGNTSAGYVILRMDDALQGTVPIFMRLDFGTGGVVNNPALWFTIGAGSDGSGNITTKYFDSPTASAPPAKTSSSSTVLNPAHSWVHATKSRGVVALFTGPTSGSLTLAFAIERMKSSSGTDNGEGVLLSWSDGGSSINKSAVVRAAAVPQPPSEQGLPHILSGRSPSARSHHVGAGVPFHFDGLAVQPGTAWLTVAQSDTVNMGRYRALVYGQLVTYQHLGVFRLAGMLSSVQGSLLMRAD